MYLLNAYSPYTLPRSHIETGRKENCHEDLQAQALRPRHQRETERARRKVLRCFVISSYKLAKIHVPNKLLTYTHYEHKVHTR
jgi:hypothetical protein